MKNFDSQHIMDEIGDEGRQELIRMFLKQNPLDHLTHACEDAYDRPGVKRGQVIKMLDSHPYFQMYVVFKRFGATSGPSKQEFKYDVERYLRRRGKKKR
jgi:hypothetical protein